jgi:adenosine deaminase
MTEELWRTHDRCGVPADQLREIALNGFRYAFLPHTERQALLETVLNDFPMPPTDETPVW